MVDVDGLLRYRRLHAFGWLAEDDAGHVRAVKPDGGGLALPVLDRLVGTREAARLLGVRAPNFVRDWASRLDFPAPVANLASGRVWLAADVARYAVDRRAPKPSRRRIADIARRVAWWQDAEQTLARPIELVARVMASGTRDEVAQVERYFGRRALDEALDAAAPGIFDRRSWNYWLLVLGRDRRTPLPARRVP